jgi:hypothetical protein
MKLTCWKLNEILWLHIAGCELSIDLHFAADRVNHWGTIGRAMRILLALGARLDGSQLLPRFVSNPPTVVPTQPLS